MDPLSIARYGMRAAEARLTASAERVAADPLGVDLAAEAVEQIQASQAFRANVRTANIADQMWRSLIDLQAR